MRRIRPYLGLFVLALVAFWPLVLRPTTTLYSDSSDLLAQHIPAKYFLVRSLRETGELPLWNPEQYAGSPFVHDIQVGLFYPPHVPLYFISESAIGPFVSWLLFLHVFLAGALMFSYARHAGMSELAAFVAGVGFMLSPRWMLQLFVAGHIVTQGICWLPLVLLCVERAIQRKRWSWAIGGGLTYSLLILGTHPQWTFFASLLIGLWPLRLLYSEPRASASAKTETPLTDARGSARRLLVRWLVIEVIVVVIGVSLSAVQLLPTYEAAGQSSRASGMGQSWGMDGAKMAMSQFVGPGGHWETCGGIGLLWAAMAILAIGIGGRTLYVPKLIVIGMLIYIFGGSMLIDHLPGFSSFRMPTRMLLTLAFPVAFLAGSGLDLLKTTATRRNVWWAVLIAFLVAVPTILHTVDDWPATIFLARWGIPYQPYYWAFAICCTYAILRIPDRYLPRRIGAIAIAMIVELLVIVAISPKSTWADWVYPPSPAFEYLREHNSQFHRVYDPEPSSYSEGSKYVHVPPDSLMGPGSPQASVQGVPSIRGYNPLDAARYREFLAILANEDRNGGAFSSRFSHPVVLALTTTKPIQHHSLLDLLGVRFCITTPGDKRMATHWARVFDVPQATGYNFLHYGIRQIGAQAIYENQTVMPRAFVVSDAIPEADSEGVAAQLQSLDVRKTATLEDWDPSRDSLPHSENPPGPATIRSYTPNEILIDLDGKTAGLLVLTDPWYPGWVCRIDGNEAPVWKADYAFRGVMVPNGAKEVVFRFEPQSYRWGKRISLLAMGIVGLAALGWIFRRLTSSTGSKLSGP